VSVGKELAITAAIVAVAAIGVGEVRAPLSLQHRRVRETSDVYPLPPPEEVVRLSLGYRAAFADVLWAHVLVSQGIHMQERRRFQNVTGLLDTINELEPTFRPPYLHADALITFQTGTTPYHEVLKAREIMERGTKHRPLDAELWLSLGSFVGFIAPGTYLTDPAEKERWKLDGARMLARAAELSGDDASIAWRAIGAAGLFHRAGQRDAEIRFLKRACSVVSDPELKLDCDIKLAKLVGESDGDGFLLVRREFERLYKRDLKATVSLGTYLLLGPPRDVAYCAGGSHDADVRCASTWNEWSQRYRDAAKAKQDSGPE
jgi:hypothetical protein